MSKDRSDQLNAYLATHDELTDLFNRRFVMTTLEHQVALSRRDSSLLSIILLDVDHFKKINDNFGHRSGDRVLQQLALEMRNRLRAQDIVGRFGGEEFVIILPNTSQENATQLAQNLRQKIAATPIMLPSAPPLLVTISMGVCQFDPELDKDVAQLIHRADQAMYKAKSEGRNRVMQAQESANASVFT